MTFVIEQPEKDSSRAAVLQKYLLPGETTWQQVAERVAYDIAQAEETEELQKYWYEKYYKMIASMRFMPAGSILANAGNKASTGGLNNCFQKDTPVVTRQGIVPIHTLNGSYEVLSSDGIWRQADFRQYGKQELYLITLVNGQKIKATGNHLWPTKKENGVYKRISTVDLPGHNLRVQSDSCLRPDVNFDFFSGARHGIVMADGFKHKNCLTYRLQLFQNKRELANLFSENSGRIYEYSNDRYEQTIVSGIREEDQCQSLKSMPHPEMSDSYWYGFFCGFLAGDGGIDSRGSIGLYQKDRSVLEQLADQLPRLGIIPGKISKHSRKNNLGKEYDPCYCLRIVKQTLSSNDFLRADQKAVFESSPQSSKVGLIKVKSVVSLNKTETVYCCNEPETNTFVVHGGILTSNCFVLEVEDNIESITQTVKDACMTTRYRGGVGVNIGAMGQPGYVRPKGAPFADGAALGPCAVLDMISDTAKQLTTGNSHRRGAFLFSMDWRHPDIWEFIQAKTESKISAPWAKELFRKALSLQSTNQNAADDNNAAKRQQLINEWNQGWTETHLSTDGKRDRRWYNANISVQVDQEFFDLLEANDEHVVKLWTRIAELAHDTADPGLLFIHTATAKSPIGEYIRTTNPCFAPDEIIFTSNGYKRIEDLVGQTVYLTQADGTQAKIDNFRVTAENQDIYEIEMASGQTIQATAYHQFILENGETVELKDLQKGDRLLTHNLTYKGKHYEPSAYLKGFLLGAGHKDTISNVNQEYFADLNLHESTYPCVNRLIASAKELTPIRTPIKETNISTERIHEVEPFSCDCIGNQSKFKGLKVYAEELRPWVMEYRDSLPIETLNWFYSSKLEFIAGYMDANGSAKDSRSNGFKYQISSTQKKSLKVFQLLLKSIGVESTLSLMKPAQYQTKDRWKLIISEANAIILSKQVNCSRLVSFIFKRTKNKDKSNWNKIKSIKYSHNAPKVYCCTFDDKTLKLPLGKGFRTHQCGEIYLPANSSCNLGSLVLPAFIDENKKIDWEGLIDTTETAVRFLDSVLDRSKFATEAQRHNVQEVYRQLGLGILGWSDCLMQLGIPYDSDEHLKTIDKWGRLITDTAYRASEQLAVEKGSCGIWPEIKHVITGNIFEKWYATNDPTNSSEFNGAEIKHWFEQNEEFDIKQMCQAPRRNSTVLSIAPTGSISQLAGRQWAFEPPFGLSIWKQVYVDASKTKQNWTQCIVNALDDLDLSEEDKQIVFETGSLQNTQFAQDNPEQAKVYHIANEISPEWHIRVQAKWQEYLDSSASKTINLPAETTVEQIQEAYLLAEKLGLKGITVYRSGTLESEPIKVGNQNK